MNEQERFDELLAILNDGKHDKIYHAILNGAAPLIPWLPAISAYTAAATQEQKDKAVTELLKYHDDKIGFIDTAIIQLDNSRRVIERKLIDLEQETPTFHEVRFNHKTMEILQSGSISSITDCGTNNYTLNFIDPNSKFTITATSNRKISYDRTQSGINLTLEDSCPDEVSLTYVINPKNNVCT